MHMSDALLSPAVGGMMWAASAGLAFHSARRVEPEMESRLPLMGVLGAFTFAAQMINFTIPLTGSSGHFAGGLLLAVLLGPRAGFLTMAAILVIQALFFADGGLLALGCNLFNMGFFPCFVAYPLIYRPILRAGKESPGRIVLASVAAAVLGLQLGAFGVVAETKLSGISALPFGTFVLLMQPIHLAIGLVEGLATAAIVSFVRKAGPEILQETGGGGWQKARVKGFLPGLFLAALALGGVASWFASTHPDGLEWSVLHAAGREDLGTPKGLHAFLDGIQRRSAFFPDYGLKTSVPAGGAAAGGERWPKVDPGTSAAGILGAALTLGLTAALGAGLRVVRRRRRVPHPAPPAG